MAIGRIISALSGFYDIATQDGQVFRTRARGEFRKSGVKPLVGDFVDFQSEDNHGEGFIWKIHERNNQIVRPPMANIDLAIIIASVKEPDFSSNLLDRQLVALSAANIDSAIVFSKVDLLAESEMAHFQNIAEIYRQIGYDVILTNDVEAKITAIQDLIDGQVVMFMGQTGAGKSTLLNQMDDQLQLETGVVSKALSRGKHTTRKVTLIPVFNALVADTPGFSSYELFDFPKEELGNYFPEIDALKGQCQFRGCLHLNEPNCAVKQAVENNQIAPSRYQSYLAFYSLIKNQKPKYQRDH